MAPPGGTKSGSFIIETCHHFVSVTHHFLSTANIWKFIDGVSNPVKKRKVEEVDK